MLLFFLKFSHLAWVQTDRKSGGLGDLKYPLISDITKTISKSYGVLIPDQVITSNCTSVASQRHASTAILNFAQALDYL